MPDLTLAEKNQLADLLCILAIKLLLLPKPDNEQRHSLAIISACSAAENIIYDKLLQPAVATLKDNLNQALQDKVFVKSAQENTTIREKLNEIYLLLQQKVVPAKQRAIATSIYRYAYKLASIAGEEFANIGKNVSADEAETLLLIRDIFKLQR